MQSPIDQVTPIARTQPRAGIGLGPADGGAEGSAGTFRVVVVAVRDVGADYPDFPHLAVRAPVLRRWIDDGDALVRQRRAVAYDERRRFARSWRLRLSRREPGRAEIGRAHV